MTYYGLYITSLSFYLTTALSNNNTDTTLRGLRKSKMSSYLSVNHKTRIHV